ncbi:hypothetical protein O3P69_014863 [Scylla paramamosain]|uniref:protein-ribulosamine 3-kinase n=1 Tax=Scylla paramamosain TaxID=85552 RepID=A0AAW0U079_SCYPA
MVAAVREVLGSEVLQGTGELGGGLISEGEVFLTDVGKVFIKWNRKEKALDMYKGETAGLQQLGASGVVRVPEPLAAVELPGGGAALVLEYLPMKDLRHHSLNLARQLARLHLQNPLATTHPGGSRVGHGDARSTFVPHFGFHSPTPCGYILQDNTWCDDWQTFFSRKLQQQIAMIETEASIRGSRGAGVVVETSDTNASLLRGRGGASLALARRPMDGKLGRDSARASPL